MEDEVKFPEVSVIHGIWDKDVVDSQVLMI